MKRPLLPVALCYAVGLLLGDHMQPSLGWLFAVSFALLALGLVWARGRVFLLWPLLILVAWTNFVVHTAVLSPRDLRRQAGENSELVSVRGVLAETPNLRMHENDERMSLRTIATLRVTALARNNEWQTVGGKILVSTVGTLPKEFFSGREVEITGVLAPPPLPVVRGLFNYRTYLARQGIYYQLRCEGSGDWRLMQTNSIPRPLVDRFLAWSQHTLARGLPEQDEPLRLTWAMTLGWKTALTDEVSEPFMRSGTMHIFAISGLHIALIAGILVGLLRVARVPRMACGAVVIPLIWFYTAATGWQSSAIRSTVMMTIIVGGWALRRPTDLLNSLAAAALIILVWDPQQLFQASFQLSFFVVLSIALFLPPLEKWRDRLLQVDPMLPPELLPRWKRIGRSGLRWVATCLATSLAAWLGSLPLSAHYFHLFSPVTLLANLVVVPMSSAALACNLGSLVCGGWFPWATELFNHCGWFWMLGMLNTSRWCAGLPGAFFNVPAPTLLTTMLYYGLLIGTLSGWLWQRERRARTFAAIALVIAFYGWQWNQSRKVIELTVLPLNGGHGIFATGHGNSLLIDCGSINAVEFVTTPFLRARGVNRLPQLLLTHGDLRHIGGAELIADEFNVGAVLTSSMRFRSPTYKRLTEQFGNDPDRLLTVNSGDTFGPWQALHPRIQDKFPQADDGAVVLLGTFHRTRVLLLSDLGRPGQNAMMEHTKELRADIVITGLPAQGEPLSDVLLAAVKPKLIVVADSEFPATERASAKLRGRLESRNIPVLYMRKTGALEFSFGPHGRKVTEADGNMRSFPNAEGT